MSEVVTTRSGTGIGARIVLSLLGAAAMILGAFLHWVGDAAATDLSLRALYDDKFRQSGHFFTNMGIALIVLGLLALLGLAFSTGWLTRLAGALGVIVVALFMIQAFRAPASVTPGVGAWMALAGSILVVAAGFLGGTISRTSATPVTDES